MTKLKTKHRAVPESAWKWFGLAGHFICGHNCRFHMATQIGEHLVSTVGFYVPSILFENGKILPRTDANESAWLDKHPNGEDIGLGRTYETMVFRIDGECEWGCGQPMIVASELDYEGYQSTKDAAEGHMKMCRKWAGVRPPSGKLRGKGAR